MQIGDEYYRLIYGSNSIASNMQAKKWLDNDVSMDPILNHTIAVIGYGIQGRAQANNMKDSGLDVIVGSRKGGSSWAAAEKDGHKVMEIDQASKQADIIHVLVPDMEQSTIYKNYISQHLNKKKALSFSHGAAIHWRWIEPPEDIDVIMVAPKGPGQRVRELYQKGFGTPSLVAVYQDSSNEALERVLAMAKAIGSTRPGVIQTTFKEEVETDWFGEQADLCGGTYALVMNAFETLVESGYQPEVAYFECLHELKLIVDLIQKYGLVGMYSRVSETARYGGLTRGPRIIDNYVKEKMREVLKDIQSGNFAEEWHNVYQKDGKNAFNKYMRSIESHTIEKIGKEMRDMMWPPSSREESR
jgi:ketol-acid reductoisomerase